MNFWFLSPFRIFPSSLGPCSYRCPFYSVAFSLPKCIFLVDIGKRIKALEGGMCLGARVVRGGACAGLEI